MLLFCQGRRRGFVLVSVLILGAMLVTCATAFTWFARTQIKNAAREKISMVNRSMAQVLTAEVMKGLQANSVLKYDSPLMDWFKPFLVPIGESEAWIVQTVPLDDKIPLRNLFLPDGSTLRNEFRNTWEDIWSSLGHLELAYVVLDFLDGDTKPKMGGIERPTHINRPLLDMSELLILEEITPDILYGTADKLGLADYCTLWSSEKINLNVAPVHVLAVLSGMDGTLADKIDNYRRTTPLTEIKDLGNIAGFSAKTRASLMNVAGFASRYFMIRLDVQGNSGGSSFNVVFDNTDRTIVRWEEI